MVFHSDHRPMTAKTMKKGMDIKRSDIEGHKRFSEEIVLDIEEYPELDGLEVGTTITGKWEGKIEEVSEDGQVSVIIDSMDIETENFADRELNKMRGKGSRYKELSEEEE